MHKLKKLEQKWFSESIKKSFLASDEEISNFEITHKVFMPTDLKEYFKTLNGTMGVYDENFFQFYSLAEFMNIKKAYLDWTGIPAYQNIVFTLKDFEQYYPIANNMCHLYCYAIKLSTTDSENEVVVVCGDKYKKIANSFSEFLDLYFENSIELQLNEEKGSL